MKLKRVFTLRTAALLKSYKSLVRGLWNIPIFPRLRGRDIDNSGKII